VNYGLSWVIWGIATFVIHEMIPDDIPINF
jgi:hypothetical protein